MRWRLGGDEPSWPWPQISDGGAAGGLPARARPDALAGGRRREDGSFGPWAVRWSIDTDDGAKRRTRKPACARPRLRRRPRKEQDA